MSETIKQMILDLSKEYVASYFPEQQEALRSTWDEFEQQGLLDRGEVFLDYPENISTISISGDELFAIVISLVVGVTTNAIYDLMKWSATEVTNMLKDPKRRGAYLGKMGILSSTVREIADHLLVWVLEKLRKN